MAGELGRLPLALAQAAAYAQATGMSLAAYLARFQQRRADMLDRGQPAGHTTVAATFSLAMSRLEADSPARPGCCDCWRSWHPNPSR